MSTAVRAQESGAATAEPARVERRWDWPVLVVCAVSALVVGLLSPADTSQEAWGLAAALGYGCAALVAARSSAAWAPAPAVVAVVGAVAVPLLYLTVISKEQMEVGVVERAADLLFTTGNPYHPAPHAVRDFNPYLPGMTLFGIPHMLFGDAPFTSARLWFLVGFLAAVAGAIRVLANGRDADAGRFSTPRGVTGTTGVLWLFACPVVALPLTIGGVDPPVIGLMCLALAFTQRGDAGWAGLALGAAAALKWTAWPAVPVLVAVLAVRGGRRAAVRCAVGAVGIALLAVLPVALADSGAFYRNVVLYPLGLGPTASSAQSPLLGHLIAVLVPHGDAVTMALIALSAAGVGLSLVVRPPSSAVAGADRLALGLILAIVLSPATRIGYAIYPIVLLAWPRFAAALSAGPAGEGAGRRTRAAGTGVGRGR
ncbi:glycosyltransferase 87 family protein [Streptomyces sp. NPDC059680]|uniref:glycosyltransferase 87 family protein n=1 Tax=Streptomyces TaxID=1883 RepID=UPI001E5C4027|nr:glycosyltransferase 87 family protein [Streptomyces barringtoniae]MCC5479782.1 glycosyltransferase 87 family protein [Streptomyces barringtoniae]